MKVLLVNKFLYPKGGSETYIFKLGEYLQSQGHEVQYFGMEHKDRIVGNRINAYTSNMDFHSRSKITKIAYPFKTIYSREARMQIRKVLEDFKPDVCHLNNFNYQLTPSIILEIDKWRKKSGKKCNIIYTAHDYQLVCPNHMCRNPNTSANCEKCLYGNFINCTKGKCIHSNIAKSFIGTLEASFWKLIGVYKSIDKIICCSNFMKAKLDTNLLFREKTIVIHNFVEKPQNRQQPVKKDYILYFGRFSEEKGVKTLLSVCKELSDIQFVFAGSGVLEESINSVSNIKNVGFKSGEELETLIREARFTVYPSEWYENCPFSVMESQIYGTPVIGADIGGIPELVEDGVTGELFESGNVSQLIEKIRLLWEDTEKLNRYSINCGNAKFIIVKDYCKLLYGLE